MKNKMRKHKAACRKAEARWMRAVAASLVTAAQVEVSR